MLLLHNTAASVVTAPQFLGFDVEDSPFGNVESFYFSKGRSIWKADLKQLALFSIHKWSYNLVSEKSLTMSSSFYDVREEVIFQSCSCWFKVQFVLWHAYNFFLWLHNEKQTKEINVAPIVRCRHYLITLTQLSIKHEDSWRFLH